MSTRSITYLLWLLVSIRRICRARCFLTNQIDRFDQKPGSCHDLIIGSLVGCLGTWHPFLRVLTMWSSGPLTGLSETAQGNLVKPGARSRKPKREYISDFRHGWIKYAAFLAITLFTATIVLQKRFSTTPQWLASVFHPACMFRIGTLFQVSMFKIGLFLTVPFCTMFATMTAKWLTERGEYQTGLCNCEPGIDMCSNFFFLLGSQQLV